MLEQRRSKFLQQLFRHVGRMPAAPKQCDDLLLAGHMALTLGDMVVHHSEIGRTEGHD